MESALWKKLVCPNCGKRVFDLSKIPSDEVEVALKCSQCHKVVIVKCTEDSIMQNDLGEAKPGC